MTTRRTFLRQVGSGVLAVGLGPTLASEIGFASSRRLLDEDDQPSLGRFEPLADMMEELSPDELLPVLVNKLRGGVPLSDLVAAGALANARRCGGTNYDGYHAFMALLPSLEMADGMPDGRAALPALKVLHRSSGFMDAAPASARMRALPGPAQGTIKDNARKADLPLAEGAFAQSTKRAPDQLARDVLPVVLDGVDVHRVVLACRAFDLTSLAGQDHASVLLRQIVRHCTNVEQSQRQRGPVYTDLRQQLPKLFAEHGLDHAELGAKRPGDEWTARFATSIVDASRTTAAADIAAALADGVAPDAIGVALSLAATQLVLRDPGRAEAQPGKPRGSVHGAGYGVHSSDSMHAWRRVARLGNDAHTAASLVVAGHYVGGRSAGFRKEPLTGEPVRSDLEATLRRLDEAVRAADQASAVACAARLAELDAVGETLDVLRVHAARQDGALHAEKYFRTQETALAEDGDAVRNAHLQALARVVASQECGDAPCIDAIEALLAG